MNNINEERKRLLSIIKLLEKRIPDYTNGTLEVKKSHGYNQYVLKDNDTRKTKYLPIKEKKLISELAQKNYDKKVLKVAGKKLKAVEKLIPMCNPDAVQCVYDKLSEVRKQFVVPVEKTRQQLEKEWSAVKYNGRPFLATDTYYETGKGEKVRSKSEVIIADTLASEKICYRYEYPVKMKDGRNIYPDFYILNSRTRQVIILEHFGMMDDPKYQQNVFEKIELYGSLGYVLGKNFLCTFESQTHRLSTRYLKILIKEFLI